MNSFLNSNVEAIVAALLSLLIGSCSDDVMTDRLTRHGQQTDDICFGIDGEPGNPVGARAVACNDGESVVETFVMRSADSADSLWVSMSVGIFGSVAVPSRAATVNLADMHDSFGVTACMAQGNEKEYYFFNEMNIKPDDPGAVWAYASGNRYYWPGSPECVLRFYAHAPYACRGLTVMVNGDYGAAPVLNYVVPTDVADQTDILTCTIGPFAGPHNGPVPLSFRHACSAVEFVIGDEMASGTIQSISINGVRNSGTYSFETGEWTVDERFTDNFTQTPGISVPLSSGNAITSDADCMIMMPQTLPDGATIRIEFIDEKGVGRTLSASIAGHVWEPGRRVKYRLSISPDFIFELEPPPWPLDAHYLIFKTTLKVSNVADGRQWTVVAPMLGEGAVTIVRKHEMNEFAKNGFWTDRFLSNGGVDEGSARGTGEFRASGSGTFDIAIFIPENTGNAVRDIPLSISVDGVADPVERITLSQLCPAWTLNGTGWEQIDDGPVPFGFNWNRQVMYRYWHTNDNKNYCHKIIESNHASAYAKQGHYDHKFAIGISYSGLTDLKRHTNTRNDGLANTRDLYRVYGTAVVGAFELVVKSATHENGTPSFELVSGDADTHTIEYTAVGECIKKNRCDLLMMDPTNGDVGRMPQFTETDIVWFLPAVDQFGALPAQMVMPVNAADCWSSTIVGNNAAAARLGDGHTDSRLTPHSVRACRIR